MRRAATVKEYSTDPYEIPLDFGGSLAGRSVIKSCLAMAYDAGLDIDQCEHAKTYLLSDGEACLGYFNEYDVVQKRPERTFFHWVHVYGNPDQKQVLAYVEYFGWQRIVACLSSNYGGERFSRGYAIDPVTGKELDIDVVLEMEPAEIPEIYGYKRIDYEEVRRSLDVLVRAWMEHDRERAMLRAIDDALEFARLECGVEPGDELSREKCAELSRVIVDRLEPFLLHRLSSDLRVGDLQKLIEKSRNRG